MSWKLISASVVVPLETVEGSVEQQNTVKKNIPSFWMKKTCGPLINSNHLAGRTGASIHDHVAPGCDHATGGSDTYCRAGRSLFRFFGQEGQHQLHLVLLLLADVVGVCGGKELVQSVFRESPVPAEPDSKLKHLRRTRIANRCFETRHEGTYSKKPGDQRP